MRERESDYVCHCIFRGCTQKLNTVTNTAINRTYHSHFLAWYWCNARRATDIPIRIRTRTRIRILVLLCTIADTDTPAQVALTDTHAYKHIC